MLSAIISMHAVSGIFLSLIIKKLLSSFMITIYNFFIQIILLIIYHYEFDCLPATNYDAHNINE